MQGINAEPLTGKYYIIFKLNGFSRNLRTELKKAKKFYFYDNGIRNSILQNFAIHEIFRQAGEQSLSIDFPHLILM